MQIIKTWWYYIMRSHYVLIWLTYALGCENMSNHWHWNRYGSSIIQNVFMQKQTQANARERKKSKSIYSKWCYFSIIFGAMSHLCPWCSSFKHHFFFTLTPAPPRMDFSNQLANSFHRYLAMNIKVEGSYHHLSESLSKRAWWC